MQIEPIEDYKLFTQGTPMSEQCRTHLQHHISLARRSPSHDGCMSLLRYCEGFIGALTVDLRCTMEEHQSTWRELNEIRERSNFLKTLGRRV